jgi:hypothetical protein
MRPLALAIALVATGLLVRPGAASDPARSFLADALRFSTADIDSLDRGEVIARTLEVSHRREVATLGVARINTSPQRYVDRLSDITAFKRTADVLQIGRFGDAPQDGDVASLTIDEPDLKQLRACRVDSCDLRLSAPAIQHLQREIDWQAPDASRRASRALLQLLVAYAADYRQTGTAAAMEYADRAPRVNVGREFASLLAADPLTSGYAPRLRRHLLEFPEAASDKITDFLYWSKELIHGRPVISITHVAAVAAAGDSPVAYAVGSKQIYATHYYDASLGLTLLVPDPTAASAKTYVVYVNRSRIDLFDRPFGGVARRVVAAKARTVVAEQLERLQRQLGS